MVKVAVPGTELATTCSISLRFYRIECITKFKLQNTRGTGRGEFFSYKSLVECIMASAPPFIPTHKCNLWKSSFASKFASLAKHLAISLQNTSPIAIGRIPPFFFNKSDNDALHRACETY